jgi:hypothetical protein
MQNLVIPAAKKRGRKPKGTTTSIDSQLQSQPQPQPQPIQNPQLENDTVNIPKKRGRKPKQRDPLEQLSTAVKPTTQKKSENGAIIVNKLDTNVKQSVDNMIQDNIIVHLPISNENIESIINDSKQVVVNESNYDHNSTWFSSFETCVEQVPVMQSDDFDTRLEHLIESRKTDFDISKSKNAGIRKPAEYTMSQFYECNKKKIWPDKTNIQCLNCCHTFDHRPAALPFKYQNGIFHVFGCFCYPECAAAFNFTDAICVENANENFNLLNLMYKQVYNDPTYQVKIASSRLCLKIFGGHLTIEEYRNSFNSSNKKYNIIMPPVISIIPTQEESNVIYYKKNTYAVVNNTKGYDGAYRKERDITLQRSKPIINKQNTLDNCINVVS